MARIALVKNNTVENVIEAAPGWAEVWMPGYDFYIESEVASPGDGYANGVVTRRIEPVASSQRFITKLAFKRRFTPIEWKTLYLASKEDVDLQLMMQEVEWAKFIDLDDPTLAAGVAALVSGNLLTQERADVVLGINPTEEEKP